METSVSERLGLSLLSIVSRYRHHRFLSGHVAARAWPVPKRGAKRINCTNNLNKRVWASNFGEVTTPVSHRPPPGRMEEYLILGDMGIAQAARNSQQVTAHGAFRRAFLCLSNELKHLPKVLFLPIKWEKTIRR